MKTIARLTILICMVVVAGCSSTGTGGTGSASSEKITPERVQRIARGAAYGTAAGFLLKKPEFRNELEQAREVLASLVGNEQWDIDALALALREAGFKALNSEEGILIVEGAITLYDAVAKHPIDLRSNEYSKAAILGALDGVTRALRNKPVTP